MGHTSGKVRVKLTLPADTRHSECVEQKSTRDDYKHINNNAAITVPSTSASLPNNEVNEEKFSWKDPALCLAPSMNGAGWGVFATRPIKKGDIVEVAPMFLRFDEEPKVLKQTILDNYHYEYWNWTGYTHVLQTKISFGYTMYYNHGPSPNIEHRKWGIEPDISNMDGVVAVGYFAVRDIQVGEELINDYGGKEWFETRGLELFEAPENSVSCRPDIKECANQYQSKLYSGYSVSRFQSVLNWFRDEEADISPYDLETVVPSLHTEHLGYGNVIAREQASVGDVLEFAPVLLLAKSYVSETLLDCIAIEWDDLDQPNNVETVNIQYRQDGCTPAVTLQVPIKDTVLIPLAGTIALISRNTENPNAKLTVVQDEHNENGFCLQVVATAPINEGDTVVLDLPQRDIEKLIEELACTGQPIAIQGS